MRTLTSAASWAVLLAACSTERPDTTPVSAPERTRYHPPYFFKEACDNAPTFRSMLDMRPLQTIYDGELTCVRGKFEVPGWLIIAAVRDDAAQTFFHSFLLLDQNGRRVTSTWGPSSADERRLMPVRLIDFDGNGSDEVIAEEIVHHTDSVDQRVVVLAPRASGVVRIFERIFDFKVDVNRYTGAPPLTTTEYAPWEENSLTCLASYEIKATPSPAIEVSPGRIVRGKRAPATARLAETHCPTRQETYVWRDGRISEISQPPLKPHEVDPDTAPDLDPICPPIATLAKGLRVKNGNTVQPPVGCLSGRFPEPGVAVLADVQEDEYDIDSHIVVLDSRGRVKARYTEEVATDPNAPGQAVRLESVVDLDGDGRDEILTRWRLWSAPGDDSETLRVFRVEGKRLKPVLERPLDSFTNVRHIPRGEHDEAPADPADSMVCRAKLSIEQTPEGARELRIVRKLERGSRVPSEAQLREWEPQCPEGLERIRLDRSGKARVLREGASEGF